MLRQLRSVAKRQLPQTSRLLWTPVSRLNIHPYRHFSVGSVVRNDNVAGADNDGWRKIGQIKPDKPRYQLTFTCKKCDTRSSHNVSKQAYHNGTVLIQCPGCKNRHLIADHLKIFSDKRITLEDILKSKGETIEKGTISADELGDANDLEWEEVPKALAEKLKE